PVLGHLRPPRPRPAAAPDRPLRGSREARGSCARCGWPGPTAGRGHPPRGYRPPGHGPGSPRRHGYSSGAAEHPWRFRALQWFGERVLLGACELSAPKYRQVQELVQFLALERRPFGRALHFDELAATCDHHVHVGLGAHVLLVRQVQDGPAVDDADADGGDRVAEHLSVLRYGAVGTSPLDRIGEGYVSAGDGGGAGAAVGLEHIAVQHDGVFAQGRDVDDRPQGTSDQAGDLVGASADLSLDRFAARARVGRAGQHRVLGGHPAQAGALAPARHSLGEGGVAQHARAAEFHQDAAFGLVGPAAVEFHRAELVGGAPVGAASFGMRSVSHGNPAYLNTLGQYSYAGASALSTPHVKSRCNALFQFTQPLIMDSHVRQDEIAIYCPDIMCLMLEVAAWRN